MDFLFCYMNKIHHLRFNFNGILSAKVALAYSLEGVTKTNKNNTLRFH